MRRQYEEQLEEFTEYNQLLSWLKWNPYTHINAKTLADRYHLHLQLSGASLKEYHLLPNLRTGDRIAKLEFPNIAIYLDHVRSPYNVGSILRTVEGLRIGKVYFSEKTPFIDHEKVQRTAIGAAELVPCYQNVPLSALPRPLIALDTSDAAVPVAEFEFPDSFTLILGNEECGISAESLQQVDHIVEIPLYGAKSALNLACAFAIAAAAIRNKS